MLDAVRDTPEVPTAGMNPTMPPLAHAAPLVPLTCPLSVGRQEARQEEKHDTQEQPESHACGGTFGGSVCAYTYRRRSVWDGGGSPLPG